MPPPDQLAEDPSPSLQEELKKGMYGFDRQCWDRIFVTLVRDTERLLPAQVNEVQRAINPRPLAQPAPS